MDSTAAQYHQGPASLPSDYALVSRYAQRNRTPVVDDPSFGRIDQRTFNRSNSFGHCRPGRTSPIIMDKPNGNSAFNTKAAFPSETTPLLPSVLPVPRIEERTDSDASSGPNSRIRMIREELPILAKYALPVFG